MKQTIFGMLSLGAMFQTLFLVAKAQMPNESDSQGSGAHYHHGPGYVDPISEYDVPSTLQQILSSNESKWSYPTAFTRNIVPKELHSHNDYWRDVPFYSAISVGAISVEADIWLYNDTLFVGHEQSALTTDRTLQSLYIDPILDTLRRQNPASAFVSGTTHNGVFDTSSTQTLYLWLDCKTDGNTTFAAAIEALKPLHDAGYLSTYSQKSGVRMGAVTVQGTGNTPITYFQDPSKDRYYFFDAKLVQLGPGGAQENVTSDMSLVASAPLLQTIGNVGQNKSDTVLSASQLALIRSQIAVASSKGIGSRYWDTPGWPKRVRDSIWRTLYEEGVALINVDDLQAAAFFQW